MPDTECGFDQKHIFLFTLDRAARMLLEGVGDLNERELREVEEPLSAPSHILECAVDAVHSTNKILQNEDPHHGEEAPSDLRQLYKAHTRRLLNYLSELPSSSFDTAVTPSFKLNPMMPEATTIAECILNLSAHISMLAGSLGVTRVALGKPQLEWQQCATFGSD